MATGPRIRYLIQASFLHTFAKAQVRAAATTKAAAGAAATKGAAAAFFVWSMTHICNSSRSYSSYDSSIREKSLNVQHVPYAVAKKKIGREKQMYEHFSRCGEQQNLFHNCWEQSAVRTPSCLS